MLSAIVNITDLDRPVYEKIEQIGTHPIYSDSDIHIFTNRKLAKNALYLISYSHCFCPVSGGELHFKRDESLFS